LYKTCCNLNLGLATKARGCKVAGQEGSPGGRPHAPKNAKECERIDPHIYKGTPTLGIRVLVNFRMFKERLYGSKPNGLRNFFISLERY